MNIQADELRSIYGILCEDLHDSSLFKKSTVLEFLNNLWVAGNQVGIGLSYRLARLHRLAGSPLKLIPGLLKSLKIPSLKFLLNLKRAPPRSKGDLGLGIILIQSFFTVHFYFYLLHFTNMAVCPPPPVIRLDSLSNRTRVYQTCKTFVKTVSWFSCWHTCNRNYCVVITCCVPFAISCFSRWTTKPSLCFV